MSTSYTTISFTKDFQLISQNLYHATSGVHQYSNLRNNSLKISKSVCIISQFASPNFSLAEITCSIAKSHFKSNINRPIYARSSYPLVDLIAEVAALLKRNSRRNIRRDTPTLPMVVTPWRLPPTLWRNLRHPL